jgi:hypothetical protein
LFSFQHFERSCGRTLFGIAFAWPGPDSKAPFVQPRLDSELPGVLRPGAGNDPVRRSGLVSIVQQLLEPALRVFQTIDPGQDLFGVTVNESEQKITRRPGPLVKRDRANPRLKRAGCSPWPR